MIPGPVVMHVLNLLTCILQPAIRLCIIPFWRSQALIGFRYFLYLRESCNHLLAAPDTGGRAHVLGTYGSAHIGKP